MSKLTSKDRRTLKPALRHKKEWDFSALANATPQTRQAAFEWELDREVDRAMGRPCKLLWSELSPEERDGLISSVISHDPLATLRALARLPPPEATSRPKTTIQMLMHVPSDIVIDLFQKENAAQIGSVTSTFIIDWKQIQGEKGIKELSQRFAKWARQNNPEKPKIADKGGRRSDPKSNLLALTCYRLKVNFDLEFRLAEVLLRKANLVSNRFNQTSMNRFVAKAEHEIEYRRHPKDALQLAFNKLLLSFAKNQH